MTEEVGSRVNVLKDSPDDNVVESGQDSVRQEIISNRRRKKLLKLKKWLDYKPIKRAMEREKVKKRKMEARLSNTKLGPSRKSLKRAKMSTSNSRVNLVIDFSFTHLMSDKDLNKCLKQLGFCYGANRRVRNPVQFYVTSFNGRATTEMEKNEGYTNWDVYFREDNFKNIFKKENLVYLTSDSDNVLDQVEDDKAYIIGGLVDHNSHKGLCLKTAVEMGLDHARLPIEENIDMKTRKVLAINHVFEIMVNVCNGLSWKEALLKVIPERKGVHEKTDDCLELDNCVPTSYRLDSSDLSSTETPQDSIDSSKTNQLHEKAHEISEENGKKDPVIDGKQCENKPVERGSSPSNTSLSHIDSAIS